MCVVRTLANLVSIHFHWTGVIQNGESEDQSSFQEILPPSGEEMVNHFDPSAGATHANINQPLEVRTTTCIESHNLTCLTAHGGSYSIYYALAVAAKEIKADHM